MHAMSPSMRLDRARSSASQALRQVSPALDLLAALIGVVADNQLALSRLQLLQAAIETIKAVLRSRP
jgi:hypothetical protein